jgi:hypothetical protein
MQGEQADETCLTRINKREASQLVKEKQQNILNPLAFRIDRAKKYCYDIN